MQERVTELSSYRIDVASDLFEKFSDTLFVSASEFEIRKNGYAELDAPRRRNTSPTILDS